VSSPFDTPVAGFSLSKLLVRSRVGEVTAGSSDVFSAFEDRTEFLPEGEDDKIIRGFESLRSRPW
jgi:hypothetical protein